eukprot:4866994-Pyramimonas_sp.AAC.1
MARHLPASFSVGRLLYSLSFKGLNGLNGSSLHFNVRFTQDKQGDCVTHFLVSSFTVFTSFNGFGFSSTQYPWFK